MSPNFQTPRILSHVTLAAHEVREVPQLDPGRKRIPMEGAVMPMCLSAPLPQATVKAHVKGHMVMGTAMQTASE